MTPETVKAIKKRLAEGVPQRHLAQEFGVSQAMVSHVACGDYNYKLYTDEDRARIIKEFKTALEEMNIEAREEAITLLASLLVGQSPDQLSRFTDIPCLRILNWVLNLRESGIWKDGKWLCESEPGSGEWWAEFLLHVLVATGKFEKLKEK